MANRILGVALLVLVFSAAAWSVTAAENSRPPNLIVFLCDNLGYGDVGCFGSTRHRTPHVDALATQGMKLTHYYVSSGVCTPSRASILTGCYPQRVNLHMSEGGGAVLQPVSHKGLHPDEITLAEVLREAGYRTAIIGKWHLGDQPQFLPTRQGFQEYFGIPYSDDMTARPNRDWPPLPLMRGEQVIEAPVDRDYLTQRYAREAIRFIEENRSRPFFLYLAQAMPGSTPQPFSSPAFRGRSASGPWGDSVEELDWATGEIMAALERLELDEQTLFVWTSDNGAPRRNPPQGLNTPLAGWGYSTAEGGMRVPFIARWPGKIPARSVCSELATSMDLLPTFARLAGTRPPSDRILDGQDIWPLLSGVPGATSPHEAFFYYHLDQLQAVRSGRWKLYLPLSDKKLLGSGRAEQPAALFDLVADIAEQHDQLAQQPEVAQRLTQLAERCREDLGDSGRPGRNRRPAGYEADPTPRIKPRTDDPPNQPAADVRSSR